VAALAGCHVLAEMQQPNSTAAEGPLNSAVRAEQPEARIAAASDPWWCRAIPDLFKPSACSGGKRTRPPPTPPPSTTPAPSLVQCRQMSAEEQARIAACTYSEEEAVRFAALSVAAYCKSEGWSCGAPCRAVPDMTSVRQIDNDELDAHAYVGRLGDACVLAFRGTDTAIGWGQDLASMILTELSGCSFQGKPCMVGQGFLQSYQGIAGGIREQLSSVGCTKSTPLLVTGHSLGGALTSLAALDLNRLGYNLSKAYTFGQPRVGDRTFASAFNQAMASIPFHRVTKADDPFVYMPAKGLFHHVGTEVYYKGNTAEGFRICDGSGEDAACQDSNGDEDVASLLLKCVIPEDCGHLTYLQPLMTFPLYGFSCTRKLESTILFP